MTFKSRCWRQPAAALAAATIFLTACAGVNSDTAPSTCPPVVAYSQAEQVRVAVAALPEGALIPDWLSDYAVLRTGAGLCGTLT